MYSVDVQYAYGTHLMELINFSNYEGEMEWFSVGYGNPVA
jgi:hypothetical protein